MRSFCTYALLLLAALAGGAFLWGLVYALWPMPVPHHKFVKYGALLLAAAVLVLWARRRVTREALGLQSGPASSLAQGLAAFAVTAALLMPLWAFLLIADARLMDPWTWGFGAKLGGYLAVALVVATVEELYFRGLLLSRTSGYLLPLAFSSLFYAGIHFLDPTADPALAGQWDGGWTLLAAAALEMPGQWLEEASRLCLLFLVGLGLGLLRLKTGRLVFCIGAHAAMVFSLKTFQLFTHPGNMEPAWIGADPSGGWAGVAWVGLLVLGLAYFSTKPGRFFRIPGPPRKLSS